MERRLLLAFVLSFMVLLVWGKLFPQPDKTPPSRPGFMAETVKKTAPEQEPSPDLPVAQAVDPDASAAEQEIVLTTDKLKAVLTNVGGCIKNIEIRQYAEYLPVDGMIKLKGFEDREFLLEYQTATSARYALNYQGRRIVKTYTFYPDSYLFDIEVQIRDIKEMSRLDIDSMKLFRLDISRLDKKLKNSRDLSLMEHAALIDNQIYAKGNIARFDSRADKFSFGKFKQVEKSGNLNWIGFRNRYFALIISPQFQTTGFRINKMSESELEYQANIANSSLDTFKIKVYYGPQKLSLLKKAGHEFEKMMRFSGWGLFDAVAKGIYYILNYIHKVIPSWGICIILLGVLIYGLTYPLTLKSMASMKKMQALQPKIAELKEKYKDNPQKLSKEQMELFKEHKINPMGGCFPIFLQMPVFIGFYQVLWRSVMLKGAEFLWIKDLSEPDRLIMFDTEFPLIGNELNILPFLMGIIMFFQQKISSKNMNVTDPTQASQQKMMMMFLPVMMVFIFYHAASGLTLYFTFFYLLTIFTQWRISKTNNQ